MERISTLEVMDMMEPLRGFKDGYIISLNFGTPPQVVQVFMDTGSDLTWVPCGNLSFECMQCGDYKSNKLVSSFYPSLSSSSLRDTCTSSFCTSIHNSDNPFDPCAMAGCSLTTILKGSCPRPCPSFSYTYGGGGLIIGSLNRDILRVHGSDLSSSPREISSFCFGCVSSSFMEPIGLVGFGKGTLSLPSQLGFLHKGFSHCFLGFNFSNNPNISSPLIIGDLAITSKEEFHFTPMLTSPMYPNSYYIGLESITVISNGNNGNSSTTSLVEVPLNLKAFDSRGNGGMLIDSGTTYTHLPEPLYSKLLLELSSKISYMRSTDIEQRSGFDLCFKVPVYSNNEHEQELLPLISFHFLDNVELVLPTESCFYAMSAAKESMVVKCLLFQSMEDGDYGPAGVFGSFQQQNVEVVYDLEKERIGFLAKDCASSAASHGLLLHQI
ncbi:hypothetical protein J5N97_008662 [Dioscorea zingiberensis]|uniref:Peptidase A1 domain-containing protein n=1 Tax=Dioscorea zingiberensis TaxID=325984 RepID=A0A9D5CWQ0_9LILI|nr:hypothetical protein J5N97_008662 [Dioscorea zingiberensis]